LRSQHQNDAIDRRPVPLSKVSPNLVSAVIAAEDARFFEHRGIDWLAVSEARTFNERHANDRRPRLHGASTITQQLAKNLWLGGDRTWWRKAREAMIALVMERVLTKEKILEHYLSAIEWGERTYGCEAAARSLFGVPAARLSAEQGAALAAMIPSPRWYTAHPAALQRRAANITRRVGSRLPASDAEDDDEPPAVESPRP
jgi:monofunctional biosynthetic peptidoglycan transglycosylase